MLADGEACRDVDDAWGRDMQSTETILLVISTDNRTLHAGPASEVARHLTLGATGPDAKARVVPVFLSTVEYFDAEGQPWRAVKTGDIELVPDTSRSPVPAVLLLDRVDAALAYLQVVLDVHPELGERGEDGQLLRVPRPTGELTKVLEELADVFSPLGGQGTRGNWLHMLAHAAGVAH
jgi:hypothetical protein